MRQVGRKSRVSARDVRTNPKSNTGRGEDNDQVQSPADKEKGRTAFRVLCKMLLITLRAAC